MNKEAKTTFATIMAFLTISGIGIRNVISQDRLTLQAGAGRKNPEEILSWYHRQGKKCGYCKVTQDELHLIVKSRKGNLTLNNLQKRSKGTLEIEKRDPTKGYTFDNDNIILACPLCNNAKSNLIDDGSWKTMFAPIMRQYYDKLLLECYKEGK